MPKGKKSPVNKGTYWKKGVKSVEFVSKNRGILNKIVYDRGDNRPFVSLNELVQLMQEKGMEGVNLTPTQMRKAEHSLGDDVSLDEREVFIQFAEYLKGANLAMKEKEVNGRILWVTEYYSFCSFPHPEVARGKTTIRFLRKAKQVPGSRLV